jgi:hypothetical protein
MPLLFPPASVTAGHSRSLLHEGIFEALSQFGTERKDAAIELRRKIQRDWERLLLAMVDIGGAALACAVDDAGRTALDIVLDEPVVFDFAVDDLYDDDVLDCLVVPGSVVLKLLQYVEPADAKAVWEDIHEHDKWHWSETASGELGIRAKARLSDMIKHQKALQAPVTGAGVTVSAAAETPDDPANPDAPVEETPIVAHGDPSEVSRFGSWNRGDFKWRASGGVRATARCLMLVAERLEVLEEQRWPAVPVLFVLPVELWWQVLSQLQWGDLDGVADAICAIVRALFASALL